MSNRYSLTFSGLIVMVVGTFLGSYFSEECTTELTGRLTEFGPLVFGAILAWFGRVRAGGVTPFGVKVRS